MIALVVASSLVRRPSAQVLEEAPTADRIEFGPPDTVRIRIGAEITASRGACRNIIALVAVPLDCPEQQVKIISEDLSGDVARSTTGPSPAAKSSRW